MPVLESNGCAVTRAASKFAEGLAWTGRAGALLAPETRATAGLALVRASNHGSRALAGTRFAPQVLMMELLFWVVFIALLAYVTYRLITLPWPNRRA